LDLIHYYHTWQGFVELDTFVAPASRRRVLKFDPRKNRGRDAGATSEPIYNRVGGQASK